MQKDGEHVLPADIYDEPHFRLQRPYIRKILLRPDAKIDTTRSGELLQRRYDILNARFIGNPVIAGVRPRRLGEIRDHAPEFLIGELIGQTSRLPKLKRQGAPNQEAKDDGHNCEYDAMHVHSRPPKQYSRPAFLPPSIHDADGLEVLSRRKKMLESAQCRRL